MAAITSNFRNFTIADPPPSPPPDPVVVYILTFNSEKWSSKVSCLDGSQPPDDDRGDLGSYSSLSLAQDVGTEWALKQLVDRLERQSPALDTEEEKDDAFDEWERSESTRGDCWFYTIKKGEETLYTQVRKICLYERFRRRSTTD